MSALDAPERIMKALEIVKTLEERLRAAMSTSGKFNGTHVRAAAQLAQAIKALSAEQRLWSDQLREHAAKATMPERIEAAVRFLADLPVGPRSQAYNQLADLEAGSTQPLKLTYDPK